MKLSHFVIFSFLWVKGREVEKIVGAARRIHYTPSIAARILDDLYLKKSLDDNLLSDNPS